MATLEGHGQPLIILVSAAEYRHSSVRRKKPPVHSSHRSSKRYGDGSLDCKISIARPQRYQSFCESGAMLESSSLQIENPPHQTNYPSGSIDRRRENKTEKEISQRMFVLECCVKTVTLRDP